MKLNIPFQHKVIFTSPCSSLFLSKKKYINPKILKKSINIKSIISATIVPIKGIYLPN
jgi:hypothetical protein